MVLLGRPARGTQPQLGLTRGHLGNCRELWASLTLEWSIKGEVLGCSRDELGQYGLNCVTELKSGNYYVAAK